MKGRTQTTREIHRTTEGLSSRERPNRRGVTRLRDPIPSPEPASRDLTTGLPNRWTLQKDLGERAWKAHHNGELLLLAMVRVDRCENSPAPSGPDRRNEHLRELGHRITSLAGPRDLLGRWETDRLLLISRPRTRGRGRNLIRKIREVADDLDLPVSLGIAFNEEVHDPPGLVRRAERDLDPPSHRGPDTLRGLFAGADLDNRWGAA